ncbi:NADAR family protein [Nocardiopsis lambiniae]|uniref:NADAR family protein n=1 Tax=Nocardiopsis lambiniae TaxID=3075539 RepID=A0ABU2M3T5_9ACTN|nr:NADAR family protein [Nocardiopsis sp. DSM 44743]MDT0327304.1 NADAR family protein [Nocardiopsis sp. DSM 44743]
MAITRPTFRESDGERVPGGLRHAFIRNGDTYFLTSLVVYADGLVDCWGLVTLEEFADKLASGWVATEFEEGAGASAHGLAEWRFADPYSYTDADCLLAEVRDTVEELNGRPTSSDRCVEALDAFLAEPDETRRTALRTAYLEIPETQRRYVLGDMDAKDGPLVAVAFGPGGTPPGRGAGARVTEKEHGHALDYFAERASWAARAPADDGIDGPGEPRASALVLEQRFFDATSPRDHGLLALRNDFPVPVTVDGTEYPTVAHAYWALSTDDPERREIVRVAGNPHQAARLGRESPRRRGWAGARTAVMLRLLRAKFEQHPDLAELLLSTGDRTILYDDIGSPSYWGRLGAGGRNWVGRLLEVVRAERCAARAGI